MEVTVVLSDKNDADTFVKAYSERKLDGKYELAFTFINPIDELDWWIEIVLEIKYKINEDQSAKIQFMADNFNIRH